MRLHPRLVWSGLPRKCQRLYWTLVSKWRHLCGWDWWLQVSVQILMVLGLFWHQNVNDCKSCDIYCSFPSGSKEFFLLYTVLRDSLWSVSSCLCPRGYTGVYCEEDIDYCVDHCCSEHGVCLDQQYNFTCRCMLGFEGLLCEVETNECHGFPCLNGATCVDLIGDYRCHCPAGFEGTRPFNMNALLFIVISRPSHETVRFWSKLVNLKYAMIRETGKKKNKTSISDSTGVS